MPLTLVMLLMLSLLPLTTALAHAQTPATATPEGGEALPLLAEARRAEFLGSVELYSVAFYGSAPIRDHTALASPATAKMIRVVITYDEDRSRRLRIDWARELTPRVEAPAAEQLRQRLLSMRQGSVLTVEYVPSLGTTLRVDRAIVVSAARHDLILAFLDLWLGQRPVSEELKRDLLR